MGIVRLKNGLILVLISELAAFYLGPTPIHGKKFFSIEEHRGNTMTHKADCPLSENRLNYLN
jgi:hypothetical protein